MKESIRNHKFELSFSSNGNPVNIHFTRQNYTYIWKNYIIRSITQACRMTKFFRMLVKLSMCPKLSVYPKLTQLQQSKLM